MVRMVLGSAALVLAVGLTVWLLVPEPAPVRADPRRGDPPVFVDGHEVELLGDLRAQAVAIGRRWSRAPLSVHTPLAPDRRIQGTRHFFGARVDVDRLLRLLAAAKDPRSAMRRLHDRERPGEPLELELPTSFDEAQLMERLLVLKDELDRPPHDARVDTETREVVPHRDGIRVDVWGTLDAIELALDQDATEVEIVARVLTADRGAEAVGEIAMDVVLGTFRTRYNPSQRAEDRTFNLRVAAAKVDGIVMLPGETFDFNELVGERNEANGFRIAPVIAAGELVDGIGGGTCQISGTLHAAAFFAGFPVEDRNPHSRPSFYIKLGLDAAVSYPSLNLRFRNDRSFPVVLGLTVEGGWVTGTVWGAEHDRQVSFVRRIDDTTAFEEVERQDPNLPTGVRVLAQRGIPGFRLRRWRIIRDLSANQAVRERFSDIYPPTTQIWRVGTGGPIPDGYDRPDDDEHPEYTADSYLSMTQGREIDGMLERRRTGRTGTRGWTVRAGYTTELAGSVAGE